MIFYLHHLAKEFTLQYLPYKKGGTFYQNKGQSFKSNTPSFMKTYPPSSLFSAHQSGGNCAINPHRPANQSL